jgi:hypothetical protein
MNNPSTQDLSGVFFIDNLHGWAIGNGTDVLATLDGGANWNIQATIPNNLYLDIFFNDSLNGWISGKYGVILFTNNGGITWKPQFSGTTNDLTCITFTSYKDGWAAGKSGTILKTSNGGDDWEQAQSITNLHLESISFSDEGHGWIAGENGTILFSGGLVFDIPEMPESYTGDLFCYPNPFDDWIGIRCPLEKEGWVEFRLYSLTGQEVTSVKCGWATAGEHTFTMNWKRLPPGLYIGILSTPEKRLSGRIIKR